MDDDELIAAVAAGDGTALRELFTRHAPWLAARLRAALPPPDVEDVLQETFLAVWRGARAYRPRREGQSKAAHPVRWDAAAGRDRGTARGTGPRGGNIQH